MATKRRLSPEVRRAEILARTREMIATQGPEGLSLRSVARWCGMSAPGVLHYFDGLKPLLEEVLSIRTAEELEALQAEVPDNADLLQWSDAVVRLSVGRGEENHNFAALETQALADPEHPAHDFFQNEYDRRPFEHALELAGRDYPKAPETVVRVLSTALDGLRLRWLRSAESAKHMDDWLSVRDTIFAGFEQYR